MNPPSPSDVFGDLFAAVQEHGLFADSIEIDGEGRLVAALYWRGATVPAD